MLWGNPLAVCKAPFPPLFPVPAAVGSLGSVVSISGLISLHYYDRPQKVPLAPRADTSWKAPGTQRRSSAAPQRAAAKPAKLLSAELQPPAWSRFLQGISSAARMSSKNSPPLFGKGRLSRVQSSACMSNKGGIRASLCPCQIQLPCAPVGGTG